MIKYAKKLFSYLLNKYKSWRLSFDKLSLIQKTIYLYCLVFIFIVFALLFRYFNYWTFAIIAGVVVVFYIILFIKRQQFVKLFDSNIFIFGTKGAGKDLLMQAGVYYSRKKTEFVSNMDYGYSCQKVDNIYNLFSLAPNTYKSLIENEVVEVVKKSNLEGKTLLLSDASIYMPSHEDIYLNKSYPSFPLFYAISRHLYNMPIVVNTQVNGRLWKKLREQVQDGYIQALNTKGNGFIWSCVPILRNYLKVTYRYYEKEDSAIAGLLPFKKIAVLNTIADKTVYMTSAGATKEMYEASNGIIYDGSIYLKKSKIVYDTRHFHKVFFGKEVKK